MAVSKTRAKLVDVARQLFAKNGVDDTTMNDIAVASKKGRRTLYTYFKSKETDRRWSWKYDLYRRMRFYGQADKIIRFAMRRYIE